MKADRERRKYRLLSLLSTIAGIVWLFYAYSWFSLGIPEQSFAPRWEAFWSKMQGNSEGIRVVGIGYLVLTGSIYLGMLTFVRNPDSYRSIAILLAASSGVSTGIISLVAIPFLLRW